MGHWCYLDCLNHVITLAVSVVMNNVLTYFVDCVSKDVEGCQWNLGIAGSSEVMVKHNPSQKNQIKRGRKERTSVLRQIIRN